MNDHEAMLLGAERALQSGDAATAVQLCIDVLRELVAPKPGTLEEHLRSPEYQRGLDDAHSRLFGLPLSAVGEQMVARFTEAATAAAVRQDDHVPSRST